jgi:ubiquinone/menaquinone biosynthesis C-methylase UbiE
MSGIKSQDSVTGDPRKRYWDGDYYQYWRQRVAEAGVGLSDVINNDAKTEDDSVYERVFQRFEFKPGRVLDVGCAWGRMFPLYKQRQLLISGVDIATPMIEAASETWSDDDSIESLAEAPAETLPYDDQHFDNVVCVATFDATYQDQALSEIFRVCKPGGQVYLTGKNCCYAGDDEQALAAEKGARAKGHPNYFTDVAELLRQAQQQGVDVAGCYLFPRRGDFARLHYHEDLQQSFYEYFLVLVRGEPQPRFSAISHAYSLTYRKCEGEL